MSYNSSITRTAPITIKTDIQPYQSGFAPHYSPQIYGFGSWLSSLSEFTADAARHPSLANNSPKSIWHIDHDIPSPTTSRDDRRWSLSYLPEEPVPIIESQCEVIHPRPKQFWILTQQLVAGMEAEVNAVEDKLQAEQRAQAVASGEVFDRSDEDEIIILPKRGMSNVINSVGKTIQPPKTLHLYQRTRA
ncbi:hypothetical protein FRC14_002706 [Serendipita sp. 396]|nr:hypothetical protein FRC14_002706 [Serendipita sp. 396]KAG8789749.1 hypothetical protein FRC15_003818 [Serendipita sp. 397]KAG8877479.1 hypothetical protein FRC20_011148 [Serendipita sp. 405]